MNSRETRSSTRQRALPATLEQGKLPEAILQAVAQLTGSELTVWGFRTPAQMHHIRWHPETLDLSAHDAAYEAHVDSHPVRRHFRKTGDGGPHRLSDHVSLAKFKSGGLYQDYFRNFGITRLAAIYVSLGTNTHVSLGVSRGGRDFSDKEIAALREFRPVLVEGCRTMLAAERAQRIERAASAALAAAGRGVIVVGPDGRVEHASDLAARLLATLELRIEPEQPPPGGFGELVARARAAGVVVERLPHSHGEAWVVSGSTTRFEAHRSFRELGLTPREAEVLHWLAEGKTNAEIGVIISAAVGTVRKHLERVFAKLGVENRASAVRAAVDLRA